MNPQLDVIGSQSPGQAKNQPLPCRIISDFISKTGIMEKHFTGVDEPARDCYQIELSLVECSLVMGLTEEESGTRCEGTREGQAERREVQ